MAAAGVAVSGALGNGVGAVVQAPDPTALVIDSPGLSGDAQIPALLEAADDCDMVLWVVSAARAARDVDARALAAIRAHFAAAPNRHRPPMLLVLTHIDQLRPFLEWDPPYDLSAGSNSKAGSIRAAMQAAGRDLGFAADEIVPVRADIAVAPYNIDALWARVATEIDEAKLVQLDRLRVGQQRVSLRELASQLGSAGRMVIKGIAGA